MNFDSQDREIEKAIEKARNAWKAATGKWPSQRGLEPAVRAAYLSVQEQPPTVETWMVDYEHGEGEPQHAVLSWLDDEAKELPEVGTQLVRKSDYEALLQGSASYEGITRMLREVQEERDALRLRARQAEERLSVQEQPQTGEVDDREWTAVGEQAGAARAGETMWSGPHLKPGERVTVVPKSRLSAVQEQPPSTDLGDAVRQVCNEWVHDNGFGPTSDWHVQRLLPLADRIDTVLASAQEQPDEREALREAQTVIEWMRDADSFSEEDPQIASALESIGAALAVRDTEQQEQQEPADLREEHENGACCCEFPNECLFEAGYKAAITEQQEQASVDAAVDPSLVAAPWEPQETERASHNPPPCVDCERSHPWRECDTEPSSAEQQEQEAVPVTGDLREHLKVLEIDVDTLLFGLGATWAVSGQMNVSTLRPIVENLKLILPTIRAALDAPSASSRSSGLTPASLSLTRASALPTAGMPSDLEGEA